MSEGAVVDDGQSLSTFVAEQSVSLTRFAYLLCGDRHRAQDLVQSALVALYRRFGDALPVAAPVAYARKAIVNAHLAAARKHAASEVLVADAPDHATDPVDVVERDTLWAAISRLPPQQRAVLVMRYYLDLSDSAIAEALGRRRGTVRSLASRACASLRADPTLQED